jgi:hypothetical protein
MLWAWKKGEEKDSLSVLGLDCWWAGVKAVLSEQALAETWVSRLGSCIGHMFYHIYCANGMWDRRIFHKRWDHSL